MRVYVYRCFTGHRFEADKPKGAICPICGQGGFRSWTKDAVAVPHFHPTKSGK